MWHVSVAVKVVTSFADPHKSEVLPDLLMKVLTHWGCCWMLKTIRLVGNKGWVKGDIEKGTLTAVTDGSYIKEIWPGLCSVVFILDCGGKSGGIV